MAIASPSMPPLAATEHINALPGGSRTANANTSPNPQDDREGRAARKLRQSQPADQTALTMM